MQKIGSVGERVRVVGCSSQHMAVHRAPKHDITCKGKCDGSLRHRSRRRTAWREGWGYTSGGNRCTLIVRTWHALCPAPRQSEQSNASRSQHLAACPGPFEHVEVINLPLHEGHK